MIVRDNDSCIIDPNGISIGYSKCHGIGIRFIMSRKNGIPIGPEYAWFLDGKRFYYTLWGKDGKVVKYRRWKQNGDEIMKEICAICLEELTESVVTLLGAPKMTMQGCPHNFHYECIDEWLSVFNASECPICKTEFENAHVFDSPVYLCTSSEKIIP